jgi:hypothetical protein
VRRRRADRDGHERQREAGQRPCPEIHDVGLYAPERRWSVKRQLR